MLIARFKRTYISPAEFESDVSLLVTVVQIFNHIFKR